MNAIRIQRHDPYRLFSEMLQLPVGSLGLCLNHEASLGLFSLGVCWNEKDLLFEDFLVGKL